MGGILWDFYAIVIHNLINLLILIVFVGVIMSWLISFGVINVRNELVATIYRLTNQITEPLLRPIRNILPSMGGLDFSPVILLLGLMFLDSVLARVFQSLAVSLA